MNLNYANTFAHKSGTDDLLKTEAGQPIVGTDVNFNSHTANSSESGLTFAFNPADSVPPEAIAAMEEAAAIWSELFSDDVSLKIDLAFEPETKGVANANSEELEIAYSQLRQALDADQTSSDDAIALENLPDGDSVNLLINNTQENQGSDQPYLDNNGSANNSTIELNTATAKALGIETASDVVDGTITFDSTDTWDFDRSDGITPGSVDFVGVAIHEIGHVLGFTSTTLALDETAGQNLQESIASGSTELEDILEVLGLEDVATQLGLEEDIANIDLSELIAGSPIEPLLAKIQPDLFVSENEYLPSPQDLFRYSDRSTESGVIDLAVDKTDKYFSLDRGQTKLAQFSTGEFLGDTRQTSHWKDDRGIGIMDPTIGFEPGQLAAVSDNDLQLLDVIGWDI